MDNNELNNLDQNNNIQPEPTPQQPVVEQPMPQTPIEPTAATVTDINNLEYDEVLKPGEELDDFHHEKQAE